MVAFLVVLAACVQTEPPPTSSVAPPAAVGDAYSTVDGVLEVAAPGVLANDTDPDGDTLQAALASEPSHGALVLHDDGSFTYAHDGGPTTADAFTYRASDGTRVSHVATVSITIGSSSAGGPNIDGVSLIDADADEPVAGFEPLLDHALVDYGALGTQNISIRVDGVSAGVQSVRFELDGTAVRVENGVPYFIAGDDAAGDIFPINPPLAPGEHTLVVTPYAEPNAQGAAGTPVIRTFDVVAATPTGPGCRPSPSQFAGMEISPLGCSDVKVSAPFVLEWDESEGGVIDGDGHGAGFTMILPSSLGTGYAPANLDADFGTSTFDIRTSSGLMYTDANTQDNAVGVGLDLPNAAFRISTTLVDPPAGTGNYEQAGLWFGVSEEAYVKLVVISTPDGPAIQVLKEDGGANTGSNDRLFSLPASSVTLSLVVDPIAEAVSAYYQLGSGSEILFEQYTDVPSAWFSKDAAGIDIRVGTRSYAGIFASHRNAGSPLTYRFDGFSVTEDDGGAPPPPPPPPGSIDFDTWRFDGVDFPTAMVWGPDGRLYVAEVYGSIRAFTIDHATQSVADVDTYTSLGARTLLGLALDPASTAANVILWASHSSSSLDAGEANSGTISRLSGASFGNRQDVVTGLPRAVANHAPNEIQFGPDGRLYIALGGNTGAGAANDGTSEFGPRPEQPLSAALLVADVKAAGFDGTCRSTLDPDGSQMDATGIAATDVPCDVQVYASGLRNPYDFVFHTNGQLYATDNGLGVEGTHPKLEPNDLSWEPGDGCEGRLEGTTEIDDHNPGQRVDLLQRIEHGAYYGHPNPSRGECVFFGGNPSSGNDFAVPMASGESQGYMDAGTYSVGVQPEPNWRRPFFSFGNSRSANSIIEYRGDAFCGAIKGDLLVPYYSSKDQVRRIVLSTDGMSVVDDETLIRSTTGTGGTSLKNPLPIAQDPDGRIYVGEFGNNGKVVVFDPADGGC